MCGRKAAYRRGYVRALDTLKSELFNEAQRRITAREPFTTATLSKDVINRINRLRAGAQ